MVFVEGVALFWVTTLTLMIFHCSLGWSASLCDLKACSCHAGGQGKLACDCRNSGLEEIILQKSGQGSIPTMISSVTIENCDKVHIKENAFSELSGLQSINLLNINNLDLDEHSFNWHHAVDELRQHPGIKITIINSILEEIPSYSFRGMIHAILIKNCTIEDVFVFSFASLINIERIDIIDTRIDNIQPQSFKKFSLNTLTLYNNRLPIFPTRTMIDIEITNELRIEKNEFDVIRTLSIKAYGMQIFRLLNNRINRLEKESFYISTKGSVIMQNNFINDVMTDSIKQIEVDNRYLKEEGKQDFTFTNNTVISFETDPFTFNKTNFTPRIEQLNILKACVCDDIKKWLTKSIIKFHENEKTKNTNMNQLKMSLNHLDEITNVIYCKLYVNNNNHNKKFMNIVENMVSLKAYQRNNCQEISYKRYIIYIVLITGSILLIIGLIYIIYRNRLKRYINVPTSNGDSKMSYKHNKNPIMIVPDGKTYRETELQVIVEQVEPIVEYIPAHKYENK